MMNEVEPLKRIVISRNGREVIKITLRDRTPGEQESFLFAAWGCMFSIMATVAIFAAVGYLFTR